MDTIAFIRRTALGLLGTLLAAALLVVVAHADELGSGAASRGLVLHDAQETLRDYCRLDSDGRLWLEVPGGSRFELVTSTADPAIANPGDGSFHPFELDQVRAAVAQLSYPLAGLAADVFVLPYPRRSGFESAAGPGLILLSPGVLPLPAEQQQAEFVHELGHVVQYARIPDADTEAWETYRTLRGIQDVQTYSASASHDQRPHEIFAEDFRALFGGATANYSGTIENSTLTPPQQVPGLRDFILSLGDAPVVAHLAGVPNPSRGSVAFARSLVTTSPLDVYDVSGRRIATVSAAPRAGGTEWRWDGRDARGTRVGPGVVFARVRDAHDTPLRVTLLP